MSDSHSSRPANPSRRNLLRGAVIGAGGALVAAASLAASTAQAQNKIAQKTANYQPTPKGNARCDNCVQLQAHSACKLVQSPIAPAGWCSVYAPKPKS